MDQSEFDKALRLVERYTDAGDDAETINDMLLDNGIDPEVAAAVARDCASAEE
jgi:hypothetical protein